MLPRRDHCVCLLLPSRAPVSLHMPTNMPLKLAQSKSLGSRQPVGRHPTGGSKAVLFDM